MFNWFKTKVELKNNKSIMSSFHNRKGIKLGSEIIIPQDFEGLIFYKEKHYNTLSCGKYKMDKSTFPEIIEKQQKAKSKLKYVKCVCHYISISSQKIEIRYKKQNFTIEFKISNPLSFTNLALLYTYKVDDDYIFTTLYDVFKELLIYVKGDYKQIKSSSLEKFGISIISFLPSNQKLSIFNTSNSDTSTENLNKVSIFSTQISTQNNSIHPNLNKVDTTQQIQSSEIIQPSPEDKSNQNSNTQNNELSEHCENKSIFPSCPKCNHTAKFNTTYCLRCGYKLQ